MKVLSLCLLLAATSAHAQTKPETNGAYYSSKDADATRKAGPAAGQEASQPFRGANAIAVHTKDSASVALQKFARLMVIEGYALDKHEEGLGYFTTVGKSVGQITPATYTYRVVAIPEKSGTLLRVTGDYSIPIGLRTITESMFWVKGNLPHAKQCFTAIDNVAKRYSGAEVRYMLKP